MLLAVTPTVEETEKLRHTYAKLHCFVYCATYRNMVRASETYKPDVILLLVHEVTELLQKKIQKIREILPDIALITLSDIDVTSLAPDLCYSLRVQKRVLQFQALYFRYPTENDAPMQNALIVSGLFMHPYTRKIFLCGQWAHFSAEEAFLLRYLALVHPRRVDVEELAKLCFTYGKKTSRSTVAARVSRINKEARRLIYVPILTYRRGEGYGIEF